MKEKHKKVKFTLPQKIKFEQDIRKLLEKYGVEVEEMIIQEAIIEVGVNKFPSVTVKFLRASRY